MKLAALLAIWCCGSLAAATTTPPTFLARRDYPSAPGFAAVADVNGDGIPDIVTMSGTGIHTVLGNETALFA
jgi:FG-GAP repeat